MRAETFDERLADTHCCPSDQAATAQCDKDFALLSPALQPAGDLGDGHIVSELTHQRRNGVGIIEPSLSDTNDLPRRPPASILRSGCIKGGKVMYMAFYAKVRD